MKESVLRAAAIASLALALIVSVTTWVGISSSSQRGSFFIGFFEFALILFLGVVAWALFNALGDVVTVRSSLQVLDARMERIEEALGVRPPALDSAAAAPEDPGDAEAGRDAGTASRAEADAATEADTTEADTTETDTSAATPTETDRKE